MCLILSNNSVDPTKTNLSGEFNQKTLQHQQNILFQSSKQSGQMYKNLVHPTKIFFLINQMHSNQIKFFSGSSKKNCIQNNCKWNSRPVCMTKK